MEEEKEEEEKADEEKKKKSNIPNLKVGEPYKQKFRIICAAELFCWLVGWLQNQKNKHAF